MSIAKHVLVVGAAFGVLLIAPRAQARDHHSHHAHSKDKNAEASDASEASRAPARGKNEAADPTPASPRPTTTAPVKAGGGANSEGSRELVQRESHIEFDDRMVSGQTAAGAIYLFQRGESEFHSMVKTPDSFRDRTVTPLLPASAKP